MKPQDVFRGVIPAAGESKTIQYAQAPINSLIFHVAPTGDAGNALLPDDMITISHRSQSTGTETLVSRVPLKVLAGLSALKHGVDQDSLELMRRLVAQVEADAANPGLIWDLHGLPFAIDLGSLQMDGSQLTITVEWGSTVGAGDYTRNLGIYALASDETPEHMYSYRLIRDTEFNVGSAHEVFATTHYGNTVLTAPDLDVTFRIRDSENSWTVHANGAAALSNALGNIHGIGNREIGLIWAADSDPESVQISVLGADVAEVELLAIETIARADRVAATARKQKQSRARRLARLQEVAPETAAAVQVASNL